MSSETIVETVLVTEIIAEPGQTEAIVERVIETEYVVENIGPQGPMGPPGPAGQASGLEHVQSVPASLWIITHGYSQEPMVAVKDSAGSEVTAAVDHPSIGLTHIVFARPTAGRARLI